MCQLPKEAFLSRTPPYMGDILWAHLEILQKDVTSIGVGTTGEQRSSLENSNFSDSFAVPESTTNRTYTQLDSTSSAIVPSSANESIRRSTDSGYTSTPSFADYNGGGGGDNSEYNSFQQQQQQSEMKYNPSQQQSQLQQRLPNFHHPLHQHQHPSSYDNFDQQQQWITSQTPYDWHQPEAAYSNAPPGMHHHPAFLQVPNPEIRYTYLSFQNDLYIYRLISCCFARVRPFGVICQI